MGLIPDHGDSRGTMLLTVLSVFWTLAALAVACRVWAKRIKKLPFAVNDYAIFAALVLATGLVVDTMAGVLGGGLGQHSDTLSPEHFVFYGKMLVVGETFWGFSNLAIKISILHLFIELFWIRPMRIACYVIMGLATCLWALVILSAFFMCRPLAYNWDQSIKGVCGDSRASLLAQAVMNLCIDISVVIIPIPVLWGLQMQLAKKLGIYFMFSVGIGICVITSLRIDAIYLIDPKDVTYSETNFALYNNLEVLLGIFNACLPVTRPVLQKISNKSHLLWTENFSRPGGSTGVSSAKKWLMGLAKLTANTGSSDNSKFRQLEEQIYPMNDAKGGKRNETVIGTAESENLSTRDQEAHSGGVDANENDSILVTRGWHINSSAVRK
ncbi:hypothetical protein BDR22DRAFT_399277 [Usnea florida]